MIGRTLNKLMACNAIRREFSNAPRIVGKNKTFVKIDSGFNQTGLMKRILTVFEKHRVNLWTANGRVSEMNLNGAESCEFKLSFDSSDPALISSIEEDLRGLNLGMRRLPTPEVDWFPINLNELDFIGASLQKPGDGLNQDHPGFKDKAYVERRNIIGNLTKGYKMADPIPRVKYSEEESKLWGHIYNQVRPLHAKYGCAEYNETINVLERQGFFSPNFIPQLEDLNQYLKKTTNWRIKPVNGILSQREFLNALAFRTFCSTQYIRHPSKPDYTPEPDIMHEFLGHIPNFGDSQICEMSQRLGILSLGATDAQVKMIGAIYWFTIEFGVCRENNEIKFYGAGPGGSFGEILHLAKMLKEHPDKFYSLDIINNPVPVDFVVQDVQPFYYVAESFRKCINQLEDFSQTYYKPFNLRYDQRNNSYEPDRALKMRAQPIG